MKYCINLESEITKYGGSAERKLEENAMRYTALTSLTSVKGPTGESQQQSSQRTVNKTGTKKKEVVIKEALGSVVEGSYHSS